MSYESRMDNMKSLEERLERMQDKGVLTEKQKQEMKEAVSDIQKNPAPITNARKPISAGVIAAIFPIFIILFIFMLSLFGGDTVESNAIQKVSETINQIGKVGEMNKSSQSFLFFTSVFGVPLIIVIASFMLLYNGLVTKEENVLGSWAQVESNLQRRVDLIPNLVSTVKGYMKHEKEVLTEVTASRSGGLGEIVNALEEMYDNSSALSKIAGDATEKLSDDAFMESLAIEQQKIGRQVNKLMGVVENYPDLRSSDQFMALQAQLEGTENRINVARMMFNDEVRQYNSSIRKIPASFVAEMSNFKRKAYFEADDEAEINTKVSF